MSFHIGRAGRAAVADEPDPRRGQPHHGLELGGLCSGTARRAVRLSTDGCSSPLPATPLAEMFQPACALHDFGYRNYVARGAARSVTAEVKDWIDTRFDAELGRICKKNFGSGPTPTSLSPYEQCMQVAGSFVAAVRTKGDPYFY